MGIDTVNLGRIDLNLLVHLDALFDEHRADLPAKRRPSEYWRDNCIAGASFMHKVEVEMRHEIGVDTILFGRDYPHPEGTFPESRQVVERAKVIAAGMLEAAPSDIVANGRGGLGVA